MIGSYLLDLHVHYKRRARSTDTHADAACQAAVARGIHGIAFTEHGQQLPADELRELRDRYSADLRIYGGAEITIEQMDLILFLSDSAIPIRADFKSYEYLRKWLWCKGGAGFLAHPFRKGRSPRQSWVDDPLDGIEVRSRNTPLSAEAEIRKMADDLDLKLLLNSDAHRPRSVGSYYTLSSSLPRDNAELVGLLRNGEI